MQAKNNQLFNDIPQMKFTNAENMWFWFISSRRIRDSLQRGRESDFRPCELIDIETLVARLYLAGKLSVRQLEVMKEYGARRRAPNQHVWSENHAAGLWVSAMRTLSVAAAAKGWIE
ncbi:MAG: hypothetical protein LBK26_04640 [Rickettsiales bacterium]|jgi:hypothetical protein|nr:hypothetical protein [Rickettsiales bacterium]